MNTHLSPPVPKRPYATHVPRVIDTEIRAQPIGQLIERVNAEPPLEYIFRGIVHPSVGVFYGPAKSGKTVLAESMLLHIASGMTQFVNEPLVIPHRKVLVIGMEEFYRNRTLRNSNQIKFLTQHLTSEPSWIDNFHVVDETFPRYMHGQSEWDMLKREIDRIGPSVVVLDSLTRLSQDPIEASTVAQRLMQRLRDLAYSKQITLIVIHHAHKMDDRPLSMSNMAGSRVIAQELDFMLGVNRRSNGTRYMKDIAYRYAPDDSSEVLTFSINDHQLIEAGDYHSERDLLKDVEPRDLTDNAEMVLAYIMNLTHHDCSVVVPAAKLVEQFVTPKTMSRPTLFACLSKLEAGRLINKVAKGKYTVTGPK